MTIEFTTTASVTSAMVELKVEISGAPMVSAEVKPHVQRIAGTLPAQEENR